MQSRPRFPRSKTRSAFTLIELLTVIAIIGILAAILIPTVGKVRKSAKKAQCVARLRQWGTIVTLCSNDYKGNIPLFFKLGTSFTYDPYVTTGKKLIVEQEKDGSSRELLPHEAFTVCPTGINGGNSVGSTRQYNFVIPIGLTEKTARLFGDFTKVFYYRASEAASPGKLMLMVEMNSNTAIKPLTDGGIKTEMERDNSIRSIQTKEGFIRHGGLANVLYLDGHVSSLSVSDTDYSVSSEKLIQSLTLR